MTARDIRVRLIFAAQVHERLVAAIENKPRESRQGLETAVGILTDMVMEMGRDDERGGEEAGAGAGEAGGAERQGQ